jgi:hypothetical protein
MDYELSFVDNQFSCACRDAAIFSTKLMRLHELITDSSIATDEYGDICPLFVFDVFKQEEMMNLTTVHIRIAAIFSDNMPPGTQAYARVLSDKIFKFKSDGST